MVKSRNLGVDTYMYKCLHISSLIQVMPHKNSKLIIKQKMDIVTKLQIQILHLSKQIYKLHSYTVLIKELIGNYLETFRFYKM